MPSGPPSTADYIAFRAAERPDSVALLIRGGAITYSAFSRDIDRFTRAVAELGVPRGGSVAVGCGSLYTHWLLLLACEQLGLAAASALADERKDLAALLSDVDLVLADPQFPEIPARRRQAITPEWLAHARTLTGEGTGSPPSRSADDPVRILRTLGTTGTPKRLLHTRSLHDSWVMCWIGMAGLTRNSRLLLTMPFVVNGMYCCATACLRAGGTVVSADVLGSSDNARAISDLAITALLLVPSQLERLLDTLPAGFVRPPSLTICCIGAAVSGALRRRALQLLATEVIDFYGSNETGFIASAHGSGNDGVSTVWPDVRVEIVDDRDAPIPRGQIGRVRVRTPDMIQGYVGNPEATRQMFKDGWFYPGDLGILQAPRALRLLGRGDDLLNLGGSKILPETLEQAILESLTLGSVGVCSAPNAAGIEELLVGIAEVPYDDRELLERLTAALKQFPVGGFRVTRLAQVPRAASGKVQRDLLKRALVEALHPAASKQG